MYGSTSDVVHQSILDEVYHYPLSGPAPELFPETIALAQCFQNLHSSSNCLYQMDPRLAVDPSDSRASIGATHYNTHVQNVNLSAPNELTVSYWSEMCENDLVTKHHSAFMAPGTEPLRGRPGITSLSVPIASEGLEESTSESPSQAESLSPSEQCYTLWKKIPLDAIIVTGPNKFVPQRLYRPFTEADKERYLERVSLSAPIIFMTKEQSEWGISLEDIRNGKTWHLVDKEERVLQDCGPSISVRINWPGYGSFKRQISSRNWRKTKSPITREKLVQSLAKTTCRFIEVG